MDKYGNIQFPSISCRFFSVVFPIFIVLVNLRRPGNVLVRPEVRSRYSGVLEKGVYRDVMCLAAES
jgi:hypothetical protein